MVFLMLLTGFLVAGMKSRWCALLPRANPDPYPNPSPKPKPNLNPNPSPYPNPNPNPNPYPNPTQVRAPTRAGHGALRSVQAPVVHHDVVQVHLRAGLCGGVRGHLLTLPLTPTLSLTLTLTLTLTRYEDTYVDAWLYSDHQRYFFFQVSRSTQFVVSSSQ